MIRVLLAVLALAACLSRSGAEGPATSSETAVRLTVQPMAAPKPALRYLLLPELKELNPGNPAQWYIRCFQEQRNFFYRKEGTDERASYRAMPLAELPAEKLRKYGGHALTQADWAARLDTPDWQVLERVQTDGMDLVLPELPSLRILATALQVRFRGQLAGRHFDEAVATAKTMFALGRHLGEHPTSAGNLTGIWTADLACNTMEEMLQQPGCPNLYWALTDLPCPLVELRKGLQGDRALVTADLRALRDDVPMMEAQLEELVGRLSGRIGFAREQAGRAPRSLRAELRARIADPEKVRAARRRLVEAGCAEELAAKFPPAQVILLDEKHAYDIRRDEDMKLVALAPWQIETLARGSDPMRDAQGLFADLLPHVLEARRAQARLEQRVALLRHVEALRLYASEHDGRLPEKLAEVAVPLPIDPFTGKAFHYEVNGATAHLRGSSSAGEEQPIAHHCHYEIIVRK